MTSPSEARTNDERNPQCEAFDVGFGSMVDGRLEKERCTRRARWEVAVNPPNAQGLPEKVRICDLCNQFSYHGFTKTALTALDKTP